MVDLCGRAEARCTDKSQRGMHDRANRGQNGIPVHGFMWKSWGRCGSLSKTRARERREGVAVTLATRRVHPSRHDLCARGGWTRRKYASRRTLLKTCAYYLLKDIYKHEWAQLGRHDGLSTFRGRVWAPRIYRTAWYLRRNILPLFCPSDILCQRACLNVMLRCWYHGFRLLSCFPRPNTSHGMGLVWISSG